MTISVVIPVKDDGEELARCLEALRRQSRRPDEIIVVDNRSSDDSAEVAAGAGATVTKCREPGIPAASSHGYDLATGDLILRLDADCVPPRSWVEEAAAAFARRPDVSAFLGDARFCDGPQSLRAPLSVIYLGAYIAATAPALGHLPLFGSNLAMRREAWQSVRSATHRQDTQIHDDLDLAFHIGAGHRIGFLRGTPMGISMRPFRSKRAFAQRVYRGFRTVAVHWPHDFPPLRWGRLALGRRLMSLRTRSQATE
ncbi:glycosyltransferase family 2 protein [Microbacterium deminutum]|uniref:4,4'-diaponeurosporenoate glycosyltransferase n=1 Tax=Microbacterium deminutum TaxID=344164 RepID=A0ABN2R1Y1_9MICO